MLRAFFSFTLIIFPFAMTSCVGGGVVHSKKDVYSSFRIMMVPDMKEILDGKGAKNPSSSAIRKQWGEPSRIRSTRKDAIWTYNKTPRFTGVVPMVGVGIPLIVPTGMDGIDIFFSKGSDIPYKAEERTTTWSGGYYGPENEGTSTSGFQKLTD